MTANTSFVNLWQVRKILIVGALLAITLTLSACTKKTNQTSQPTQQENQTQSSNVSFANPKKSAHYESNTPEHAATLAGVPINVVINFNFDLAKPSSISITKDGEEYGQGETIIDSNKLTLRRNMDPAAQDGLYTVTYNACWPDGSCHNGSFQFAIDRSQSSTYNDKTAFEEVKINMQNIAFTPRNMKIKRGTTVMWINNDNMTHYVNTDSHPAHTYLLDMNSKALEKGDTYSYTFEKAGIYPYHCSAHADNMAGTILVE